MEYLEKKPAPAFAVAMSKFSAYVSQDLLGGPKFWKLAWIINFQKFGTFFFVGGLIYYFENYSTAAWVYLALHGSYGFCWLLKDLTFPDASWDVKITFGGALMSFVSVLGPYWVAPFLLISGILGPEYTSPSDMLLMLYIFIHTLGVAIMLSADAQKFYTLKYQTGLISEGMFKYIRHPNYLGEIMIYGSYALIVGHWIPWAILAWVWLGFFLPNILLKESSLSRYPEWPEYKKRSKMLIPGIL